MNTTPPTTASERHERRIQRHQRMDPLTRLRTACRLLNRYEPCQRCEHPRCASARVLFWRAVRVYRMAVGQQPNLPAHAET